MYVVMIKGGILDGSVVRRTVVRVVAWTSNKWTGFCAVHSVFPLYVFSSGGPPLLPIRPPLYEFSLFFFFLFFLIFTFYFFFSQQCAAHLKHTYRCNFSRLDTAGRRCIALLSFLPLALPSHSVSQSQAGWVQQRVALSTELTASLTRCCSLVYLLLVCAIRWTATGLKVV